MIGRAAYDNPYLFATVDRDFYDSKTETPSRQQIVEAMLPYIDHWMSKGVRLNSITRHMLQIFARQPGTKAWKRYISQNAFLPNASSSTIKNALQEVINNK